MIKNFLKNGLLLSTMVLALTACKKEEKISDGNKPVVKIGVSLPLSGSYASIGNNVMEAMKVAVEDFESKGSKYNYEIMFEDDLITLKKTQMNANKFVSIDKIDIFSAIYSGGGNVANSVLGDKNILNFSWSEDPNVANRDLSFNYGASNEEGAKLLATELKKKNINNVNIFMQNVSYFVAMEENIKNSLENNDIDYTFYKFNVGERDFKSMIEKSEKSDETINLLLSYTPDLEILAKQIFELGSDSDITSIGAFQYSPEKELFEDKWFVMANFSENEEFLNKLKRNKNFNKEDAKHAYTTYNAYNILLNACEKADFVDGKIDVKQVAKNIIEMGRYDTDLGVWSISENGTIIYPSTVGIIKNGKIENLK